MNLDTSSLALVVAGMAAVTYVSRYPILFLAGRFGLPRSVMDALSFVPPAVLIAVILPSVLLRDGGLQLDWRNEYLAAALVTAFISWRSQRLFLAILCGMLALWLWRGLLLIV
ncbi:MAG: AzlD domain-containing protein [Chloroflexota bacterium]|jgi:branched-subunit amino acid transport protein|nr:AzlD domain-containing protein [Chloroflexota bacterium]